MNFGIKGKNVLITGASQGIGREISLAFNEEGCKVSIIARREVELKKVVEEIGGEKKGHSFFSIDLMEDGAPERAINYLTGKNGNYDIIVHNIGGTLGVKNILSPMKDWYKVWKLNVGVAIEMNQFLVPHMQKQKWGRIIHISSISGINLRGSPPYGAAKSFLNAYTTVLGRELAQNGIVVSALLPGAVYAEGGHWDENSDLNKNNQESFFKKKSDFLRHHHAIGRLGNAKEIAPFAVMMASEQVSFATTSLIPIDGGTM